MVRAPWQLDSVRCLLAGLSSGEVGAPAPQQEGPTCLSPSAAHEHGVIGLDVLDELQGHTYRPGVQSISRMQLKPSKYLLLPQKYRVGLDRGQICHLKNFEF